jgi:hypothetical protein
LCIDKLRACCIMYFNHLSHFSVYVNNTGGQDGPKHVAEVTDEDGYRSCKEAFHYQYRTFPQIYSSTSCSTSFLLWRKSPTGARAAPLLRLLYHSLTHTHTHTHSLSLPPPPSLSLSLSLSLSTWILWTTGQLVAEAATCATHNKHKRLNIQALSGFRTCSPSNLAAAT